MADNNKLSIYLIKKQFTEHSRILKSIQAHSDIPEVGTFYYWKSYSGSPAWVSTFFGRTLKDVKTIFSASAKAILLISIEVEDENKGGEEAKGTRIFAIPFGYGWQRLEQGVYEERFGLKTTLNIVKHDKLMKIQKKNIAAVPKDTSEQLGKVGVVSDFGIDVEQDLLVAVTGFARNDKYGKIVSGKDALSLTPSVDISNIKEFLKDCYERYLSDEYKAEFGWIDQIAEVKSPQTRRELDKALIDNIKKDYFEKTWMAVPEIIKWEDISGFRYISRGESKDDINLPEFLRSLRESSRKNMSINILKNRKIDCISASSEEVIYSWSAYNCLYCEVRDDRKQTYLLSNGKWYEIEQDFAKTVNKEYEDFRSEVPKIQLPSMSIVEGKLEKENEYIKRICEQNNNLYCMDCDTIQHGTIHSKIEFCDVLTKDNKFIYVKKYGASSVLSHLFAQGLIAGELFFSDAEFRKKVNKKLPENLRFPDAKPTPRDYEIMYAVVSSAEKDLEIPFFSKVNLRRAKKRLIAFGYNVSLLKVSVAADN
jgi:uncharacterized protein (TIGR04141 family)